MVMIFIIGKDHFVRRSSLVARRSNRVLRRGFTVTELIIVLAIISLVVGATIPLFSRFQSGRHMRTAVSDVMALMRTAHSQTTTFRKSHSLVMDMVSGDFWVEDEMGDLYERTKHLPRAVKFEEVTGIEVEGAQARITFLVNGGVKRTGEESLTVTLKGAKGKVRQLQINPVTGSIIAL